MVTLRCTQKLLARVNESTSITECLESTNALGDWYCNLVRYGRTQVILCVSEKSYLTVMVSASPGKTFGKRMLERLEVLMRRLNIPEEHLHSELGQMQSQCCGRTKDRAKVGVMNQIALDLGFEAPESIDQDFLTDSELRIAGSLYGGPKYTRPGPESKKLLGEMWSTSSGLV